MLSTIAAFFGGSKLTLYAILATICLIATAVIARNCRMALEPEPAPRINTSRYEVVGVPSGNEITVRLGIGGRRTGTVSLSGLSIPSSVADESRANLATLAGASIRVEVPRHGLFRQNALGATPDEAAPVPDEVLASEACSTLESSGAIVGVVYGGNGSCCQVEQLRAGLAEIVGDVPREWQTAQKAAKKAKQGFWGK